MRSLFENPLAFLLRHAPEHSEGFALTRLALELLEPVKHFLFGLVANAARVVEHQFGCLRRLHLAVALPLERADHLFGVVHVHLATEGFDIERFHHARVSTFIIGVLARMAVAGSALFVCLRVSWVRGWLCKRARITGAARRRSVGSPSTRPVPRVHGFLERPTQMATTGIAG